MQPKPNQNVFNKNRRKLKISVNGDPSQIDLINKSN